MSYSLKSIGDANLPVTLVSATYSALDTDYVIDATSGTFTVTLPTSAGIANKLYIIKNSGAGVTSVATTGGQLIDGSSAPRNLAQYGSLSIQSDGSNWIITAGSALGAAGTSGTSGSSGTSGAAGTSGSSGTSGVAGTSGSSGTSGVSSVPYFNLGTITGSATLDYNSSPNQVATQTGNVSLTINNVPDGGYVTLIVTSSGAGNWTITPVGVTARVANSGGGVVGLGPAGSYDIVSFTYDGVNNVYYFSVGYTYT